MKRIALILILALICLSGLSAETVLLCISDSSREVERADWPLSVMRAVEDGILDVFFEAGHIVTNAFFDEYADDSDPSMPPGNVTVTTAGRIWDLAKMHGAGIVLHLTVFFPDSPEDNLPMPEKFEYTVYRSGKEAGGLMEFFIDELDVKTGISGLDLCTEAGRILAERLSSEIKTF